MRKILKLIASACLIFLPFTSAQAVTVNLSKTTDNNLAISIPSTLGFFKVQTDASNSGLYGLMLKDPESGIQFKITADDLISGGANNLLKGNVLYNQVVNDLSNPGQKVRRIKVTLDKLITANNTTLPLGTHNFDVYLINQNGDITSNLAEEVSPTSVPVEFKGGNGQPLSIFIESSFSFHSFDINKYTANNPVIYLNLHNSKISQPTSEQDKYVYNTEALGVAANYTMMLSGKDQPVYYKETYGLGAEGSQLIVKNHDIYISSFFYGNNPNIKAASLSFYPTVLQTKNAYDIAPPHSGWYEPAIGASGKIYSYDDQIIKQPISNQVTLTSTQLESQATYLITHGNSFQNAVLPHKVFANQRFYVVTSVDKDGHIRLKQWYPNMVSGAITATPAKAFDFSQVTNGDTVWWGNLVRWLTTDTNGHNQVHEGYIGWHSPDGSYAFIHVNNETMNSANLPKVGSLIAFEYVKN